MSDQQDPTVSSLPNGQIHCPGCFSKKRPAAVCEFCGHNEEAPGPEDALKVQTTLKDGRYRVGKLIAGSPRQMVTSYLGLDLRLRKRCVIEEYFPAGAAVRNPQDRSVRAAENQSDAFQTGLDLFFHESRQLAAVRHTCLLVVMDHFAARGTAYRVTDFHGGEDLERTLDWAGGRFGEREAAAILTPILEGLCSLHSSSLLHGDVRPANLKLVGCREPGWLSRFPESLEQLTSCKPILSGYAAARLELQGRLRQLEEGLAAGYAAPERYQSKAIGPRSDIYSCAATLYRMVTGKRPPAAPDRMADESRDCLPMPRKLCRSISRSFESVLLDGLALDPEERPANMLEFRRLLIQAGGLSVAGSAPALAGNPAQSKPARREIGARGLPGSPHSTPPSNPLEKPDVPTHLPAKSSDPGFFYFCSAAALIVFLLLVVVWSNAQPWPSLPEPPGGQTAFQAPPQQRAGRHARQMEDALSSNDPARLRRLLEDQADPNACDDQGTPLIILAVRALYPEGVRALLQAGADVNAQDAAGWTPLKAAIQADSVEIAEVLLHYRPSGLEEARRAAQASANPALIELITQATE